jgi:hypothetical protein
MTVSLFTLVALHIQLGRGTLEFHFGVFAGLALLLLYRDWRPIVAGALSSRCTTSCSTDCRPPEWLCTARRSLIF